MCTKCAATRLSRRDLLAIATAAAVVATLPPLPTFAQSPAPPPNAISPDDALKRLQDGNARYAANSPTNKDYSAGRAARASAQYPFASIVSCADSRVAPELAFDQGRLSVKTLLTAKPILSDLVSAGKLKVVGAVYDIATGKVTAV